MDENDQCFFYQSEDCRIRPTDRTRTQTHTHLVPFNMARARKLHRKTTVKERAQQQQQGKKKKKRKKTEKIATGLHENAWKAFQDGNEMRLAQNGNVVYPGRHKYGLYGGSHFNTLRLNEEDIIFALWRSVYDGGSLRCRKVLFADHGLQLQRLECAPPARPKHGHSVF